MVFPTDPVRADSLKGAEDRLSNAIGKRVRRPYSKHWRVKGAPRRCGSLAMAIDAGAGNGGRSGRGTWRAMHGKRGRAPRRTACRRPDRRRVAPRRSRPMAAPQDTARQAVSDSQTIVAPRASHASRNGAYRASTRLRRTLNVGVTKPLVSFQTESTTTTKRSFS
ncbi:hypothetical protein NCM_00433 [Burkholderia pseudomallei]